MKRNYLLIACLFVSGALCAQSKTTEKLQQKYDGSLTLFFYNNTLRMINQSENKEFDEMIKDIEKMKLLVVKKESRTINYKEIINDYHKESFTEIMTSRHDGKNFDVFLKEKDGKNKAMLVLANDADNLYVLDIVGSIAFNKVTSLYSFLDNSKDVGNLLKQFNGDDEKDSEKKDSDSKK